MWSALLTPSQQDEPGRNLGIALVHNAIIIVYTVIFHNGISVKYLVMVDQWSPPLSKHLPIPLNCTYAPLSPTGEKHEYDIQFPKAKVYL